MRRKQYCAQHRAHNRANTADAQRPSNVRGPNCSAQLDTLQGLQHAILTSGKALQQDGSPGTWQYAAPPDSRLATIDGIAFDVTGRLWFTVNYGSDGAGGKLGTLDESGAVTIFADSPGWLDYPTQVVFGSKPYNQHTLYLSNAGLLGGMPNILSFDVGVTGVLLPADK